MELFYRPKHMKPSKNYISLINACNFVVEETVWYAKWWAGALRQIANKFYQFGELMQKGGVWVIEKIDEYVE